MYSDVVWIGEGSGQTFRMNEQRPLAVRLAPAVRRVSGGRSSGSMQPA